jgi:hypothetical protein
MDRPVSDGLETCASADSVMGAAWSPDAARPGVEVLVTAMLRA